MEATEFVLFYRFDSAWSWKECCEEYCWLMSSLSFLCVYFSLENCFSFSSRCSVIRQNWETSMLKCLASYAWFVFISQGQLQDLGRMQSCLLGWWAVAKCLQPQPYHRFSMTLHGKLLDNLWFKILQTQLSNSSRCREVTEFLGCFILALNNMKSWIIWTKTCHIFLTFIVSLKLHVRIKNREYARF